MTNHTQVQKVNQMWNTLSTEPIQDILSEDMEYVSVWVLMSIIGKEKFLYYMNRKLKTISDGQKQGKIILSSKVVTIFGFEGEDFVQLNYQIDGVSKDILIRVVVNNSLIQSIQLFPKSNEKVTIKF